MESAESGFVRTETARIHFMTFGNPEATPIVVLHGNGEDIGTLDAQITAFAADHWVIAIDSRGHGKSSAGDLPWDFALFARDVVAVLDETGVRSADYFGYSDGGNTVLQLIVQHPQRVRCAVVVGANLDPSGLHPWTLATMVVQRAVLGVVAKRLPCVRRTVARLSLMVDHPQIDPVDLRRRQIPVLVMAGERDVIRAAHTGLIATSLPKGRALIMSGAGHDVPMTHAKQCAQASLDFFTTKECYAR
ncbi:alpha/beta fold hydrolase [Hoyosella rhizosphaerae]|uniref:Esterase n=1 Tax=Hoyosella rhizosphaerae TaxID=1755582 RepID=A0A916UB43_9ACTN|nr:alpha/beta hydrolase [Hoyosella rhizosphaerae]MBN4925913.1 alpha/beta fold hydrolase [Hoyosella rhizosphaerae]GGC66976.1 esterase [Hoyosella rhizosphaerae]